MVTVYMRVVSPEANGSFEGRQLLLDAMGLRWPHLWEQDLQEGQLPPMERDSCGKPYFPDYPQLHFNLSHTRGCVCCALSDSPVGVDVELRRHMKYEERIVGKFSPREQKAWEETPKGRREKLFFQLWVLKESYVKALGRGLRLPLHSFTVWPEKQTDRYRMHLYDLGELPYELAVCSEEEIAEQVYEI
ncbi:MAG: 4'-phosphopantetheinyl transferase superfamily protein [Lachnospiraceae bacterium]|nr:4'-phosphopantetheinyl transferase superfamily protein [Lachnospiraceae bacterium]